MTFLLTFIIGYIVFCPNTIGQMIAKIVHAYRKEMQKIGWKDYR
jgi:hypothetical protein